MLSRLIRLQLFKSPPLLKTWGRYPTNTRQSHDFLNVNTQPVKDVILYKNDNARYFKFLNYFAVSQWAVWLYLAHFNATFLRDIPARLTQQDTRTQNWWWQKLNLSNPKVSYGLTIFCAVFANLIIASAWTHTLRSVRYLILRKGGSRVSFVTYTPFGKNRIMDVPLSRVCAVESRHTARAHVPIKVQGKRFYYLLDSKGEFLNGSLFDATAGLQRAFKGL